MIFAWLGSKAAKLAATVLAVAGFIAAVFLAGKRDQKRAERVKDLEAYVETKKEIDDVEAAPDRDAAVERLRDNGWLR